MLVALWETSNLICNHMYADDLSYFCSSLLGLNELLAVCSKCIVAGIIAFNAIKSYGMMSAVKKILQGL